MEMYKMNQYWSQPNTEHWGTSKGKSCTWEGVGWYISLTPSPWTITNGPPKWTTWKDGQMGYLSGLNPFFMLLVSCSAGAFIRPLWWQIPWVASKNLALRRGRRLVKIWISIHRLHLCLMSKFLTPWTCELETKTFVDTVFTIIDQNNQALVTLVLFFSR